MPNTESEYLDLDTLRNLAENINAGDLESNDYSDVNVVPVGEYISTSRSVKGKRGDDGHLSFVVSLDSGIQSVASGKIFGENSKYPLKHYPSTRPWSSQDRPGTTSGVAEYLKAAGFKPKGMDGQQLFDAMVESQTIPVKLFIAWTDRGEKQADGTYTQANLKTRDFNVGTKEEPVYSPEIVKDGKRFTAKAKVASFSLLK